MAQTYTELYVQLVFAVKRRRALIKPEWAGKLFAYITGIVQNRKHELIIINGVEDHIHILIRMHPSQAISDLIRDIKSNSSRFVNDNHFVNGAFEWQRSYGAFTYSKSQVPQVKAYIQNQKEHHKKISFKEEMLKIFADLGIDHSEEYGFVWLGDGVEDES